jgi:uncharacterized protein (DUF1778 family)
MKSAPDRQRRDSVQLRCDPAVAKLVKAAAHRELCGEGEFLRQACIDAMTKLGMSVVDPDPPNFQAVKRIIFYCKKWFKDQLCTAAAQADKPSESEFIRAAAIERALKLGIRLTDFEQPHNTTEAPTKPRKRTRRRKGKREAFSRLKTQPRGNQNEP